MAWKAAANAWAGAAGGALWGRTPLGAGEGAPFGAYTKGGNLWSAVNPKTARVTAADQEAHRILLPHPTGSPRTKRRDGTGGATWDREPTGREVTLRRLGPTPC